MVKGGAKGRKGKHKAENGAGDAGPAKKIKVEASEVPDNGLTLRWEWEGDKRIWTQFSAEINDELLKTFNSGGNKFQFSVGAFQLLVKLDSMVQRNCKTGFERRVRVAVRDESDGDYYAWESERISPVWDPLLPAASVGCEIAKASGEKETEIKMTDGTYSVDLTSLVATNLTLSIKHTKLVRRVKSDAVLPPDSAGATPVKVKDEPKAEKATKSAASKSGSKGSAAKSGRKGAGKSGLAGVEEEGDTKVKTVILKGRAPVDAECDMNGKAHVFSEGKDVWDCMLNQTNLGNNNNKYYLIQLLEDDSKKAFYVWQRWGRVGYKGQNNLVPCGGDLDKAKNIFTKKFADKTKNSWASRNNFEKVPGKYDLLAMDYNAKGDDEMDAGPSSSVKEEDNVKVPDSKLDTRLQDLVNLICDVKSMEEAVVEMKYDAKKAPLGKLTKDQIKAGYSALKVIDECIRKNDFGTKLVRACDDFYTRIPHEFGMRQPPVIKTKEMVEMKMQLLEALGDIEIAIKTLKMGDRSENPVDRHYHSLKCGMNPMDKKSGEFKLVSEYLQNTHAATHNQYKMEILDMFELDKDGESASFQDYGNNMLLWHGSRLTNWVGILSQGLRIAPPEAPVTGYMFGKGVYFADMSSKSANYCFTTKAKNTGLLLLSEVSLGQTNDLLSADYRADKLPAGKHSVWGKGAIGPDPSMTKTLTNGTKVPIGKSKNTGVKNPAGYTLNYNEFIVYDTRQIKMKYLLKVKFNYR